MKKLLYINKINYYIMANESGNVLNLDNMQALWSAIDEKFSRKTDNTIPTRTVFAYKTSKTRPGKPYGGSWDNKTNEIIYPKNNPDDHDQESKWGPVDEIARPVWMSVKTFATEPVAETQWSEPTMISGEDGAPGADGINREFVYILTINELEKPGGTDPNYASNLPSEQVNGFVPEGWKANPTGISEEMQCEWQLSRTKNEDGSWSKWSGPFLWSKYGVNGQDGDSVEYIYKTTEPNIDDNGDPILINGKKTTTPPTIPTYDIDSDEYQGLNQYHGISFIPDGWSDNPVDVTEDKMWCWVSQRKKLNNKWQAFSEPSLWSKYGETGQSGYSTVYRYTVTNKTSSYDDVKSLIDNYRESNPGDLPSNWMANVPNDLNDDEVIWAIVGMIDMYTNKLISGSKWEGPYLMSGTIGKDGVNPNFSATLFCYSETQPTPPTTGSKYTGATIEVTDSSSGQIFEWQIAPDSREGRWWMVTGIVNGNTKNFDEVGSVQPYNGMDGTALPGIYTEYRFAGSDTQNPPIFNGGTEEDFTIWTLEAPEYDTEYGSMWVIWATIDPNSTDDIIWYGPRRMSGEPGKSITGETGPSGIPGSNYENLYSKGSVDGPELGWDTEMKDLDISSLMSLGWSQTPPSVSASFPYVWCIQARLVYEYDEDNKVVGKIDSEGWSDPYRLSGLNVLDQPNAITLYATLDNPIDSVMCDENGVVSQDNLGIQTTFHIYKGTSEKEIKSLKVDGELNGITYVISGSTITVNKIEGTDPKVTIPLIATVQEGENTLTYKQVFIINKIYASEPTIVVDFGNENITIPTDQDGLISDSIYPIETTLNMYVGTKEVITPQITSEDCKFEIIGNTLKITELTGDNVFIEDIKILNFKVTGEVDGVTYTRNVQLRLVKVKQGRDSIIYNIVTNANSIRLTQSEEYSPSTLIAQVMKKTGDGYVEVINDWTGQNLKITYNIDNQGVKDLPVSGLDLSNSDLEINIVLELINTTNNTVIDRETMYLLHDGLPAVMYRIQANRDVVQYDNSNKATDKTDILCTVTKIDGSEYSDIIELPIGFGLYYSIDDDNLKPYTIGQELAYNSFNDKLSFYLYKEDANGTVLVDHDTVIAMKPIRGERGRIIYPAGVYSKDVTYVTDNQKAPYVLDPLDKKFYLLEKEMVWAGTEQNKSPYEDYNEGNNSSACWIPFEQFEAIYSEIGVFNQALVGSAVFWHEYVFSQQGKDKYGNKSTSYENFCDQNETDPYDSTNGFYPNVCFNFGTGEAWLAGSKIRTTADGDVVFGKGVTIEWSNITGAPEDFGEIAAEIKADAEEARQSANNAALEAENAAKEAEAAVNASVNASKIFDEWLLDGVLSPIEQKELKQMFNDLTTEYNQIIADIDIHNDNGVIIKGVEEFKSAYSAMKAAVEEHTIGIENGDVVEKMDSFINISNYYSAKQTIFNNIYEALANDAQAKAIAYTDIVKEEFNTSVENLNNTLSELKEDVNQHEKDIDAANDAITNSQTDLTNKINTVNSDLTKAINDGDTALTTKLEAQAETITTQADTLSSMQTTIDALGTGDSNILSPAKITELALCTKTEITEDQVKSGSMLALVGEFGTVKSLNLVGDMIAGKTVQSSSSISGAEANNLGVVDDPKWKLNDDGSGYLASKNIEWNAEGKVTLGSDVTIKWDSIKDAVDENIGTVGVGVESTKVEYAIGTSGTTAPTSGWEETVPNASSGDYVWTRIIWTYTDGSSKTSYSVGKYGSDGTSGSDGLPGKDGVGISSTTIEYAINDSGTTAPTSGWGKTVPNASSGDYIWTRIIWTYTDETTETSYSVGRYGVDGTTENLAENIATALENYKITSNTIAGKTFHSTETGTLTIGTEYFAINEDGTFAETLSDGSSVVFNADGNPTTKETDTTNGPLWQIGWDGTGHLAGGNVRWDNTGNLTVEGKINGNVAGSSIGPWQTFVQGDTTFIADGQSYNTSTNAFGNTGRFKIGGSNGIVKTTDGIRIGTTTEGLTIDADGKVTFGENVKLTWDSIDGAPSTSKVGTMTINGSGYTFSYLGYYKYSASPSGTAQYGYIWIDINQKSDFDKDTSHTDYDYIIAITKDDLEEIVAGTPGVDSGLSSATVQSTVSYDATTKTFIGDGAPGGGGLITSVTIGEQVSESDIVNIINKTEIDGNKIKTGTITANQIAADAITADKIVAEAITADKIAVEAITADKIAAGAITAAKIDTDELTVKKLDTNPDATTGKISIQGNDINVYNSDGTNKVLTVSGDTYKRIEPFSTKTISEFTALSAYQVTNTVKTGYKNIGVTINLTSYPTDANINISLDLPNIKVLIERSDSNIDQTTIQVNGILWAYNATVSPTEPTLKSIYSGIPFGDTTTTQKSVSVAMPHDISLKGGYSYTLRFSYQVTTRTNNARKFTIFTESTGSISLDTYFKKVDIMNNGFRYIYGDKQFLDVSYESSDGLRIYMRANSNGITINNSGIILRLNDILYKATVNGTEGTTSSSLVFKYDSKATD